MIKKEECHNFIIKNKCIKQANKNYSIWKISEFTAIKEKTKKQKNKKKKWVVVPKTDYSINTTYKFEPYILTYIERKTGWKKGKGRI